MLLCLARLVFLNTEVDYPVVQSAAATLSCALMCGKT